MATSYTPRLALAKPASGDTGWGTSLSNGFDDADARLFLSGAGDPNGVVTSQYVGQRYWDTTNEIWYTAVSSGVNDSWAIETILQIANNSFIQWRDAGDANWRALIGLDDSDIVQVGHQSHELTLNVDAFANLLAAISGDSRRIIVADDSDKNAADILDGHAPDHTSGGSGYVASWNSHIKLPVDDGGNQLVLNYGFIYQTPNGTGSVITLSYAYPTVMYFAIAAEAGGGPRSITPTAFEGFQVKPYGDGLSQIRPSLHAGAADYLSLNYLCLGS